MGYGLRAPKSRVRGADVSGRVEAVGKKVVRFKPGDEVFGTCDGAFAEYARAGQETLAVKPVTLTFAQAAAVPTSALTALQAVRAGAVSEGIRVLVLGASGGVGSYAVQLAKILGGEVTGVCSTKNLGFVRSIGADDVVDYTMDDVTEGGGRWDVVIDIAGNRTLSSLRRVLSERGVLVIVGGEGGDAWFGGVDRQLRAVLWSPFVRQTLRPLFSEVRQADLEVLRDLIDGGTLKPFIDRTFPLAETADAIRYVTSGCAHGKVVIAV
jgi:NADPH:quinone reductase-like Zn-dependent oxidoreductase